MQGSCRLGPGLAQPAGSEQDTLSTAVLAQDLSSSIRHLARVAFVLLVAWEVSSLKGQVSVVSRSCPHIEDSGSQSPVQD